MANIDLDRIIRDSKTPQEAFASAEIQSGGNLSSAQRQNLASRILNSTKFKGTIGGSGSTNFTGGGTSGSGLTETPKEGGLLEKGLDVFTDGVKSIAGVANTLVKGVGKTASFALETQMGKSGDNTLLDIANSIGNKGIRSALDVPAAMMGAVGEQLKQESILLSEVNTKIGISGELSDGLRYSMIAAQGEARKYGFELENIGQFYTTLAEQSGKFSLINAKTIERAAPVAAALGMTMSELATSIGDYEKVGIGAKEATEAIGKSATNAVTLGLNAKKVSDGMRESVGKLNEFGFKNGIQGLERMVQKSIEFKVSMENVSTIAEKVLNPEGAIDLAANLQVLGGAIGDFGDPIKMMYDATNNVEGLQDSLIGAAKGLATYNQEQGRFEITGINLRRAREMANSLGISMGDLTKTAVAAQERMAASTALMSTGLNMNDKEKEFLTNLSRMEGGEMKIVVPESIAEKLGVPTEVALDKLDQKTKDALVANQKEFEKMNPEKMAMAQLTETQKMVRDIEVMATWAKIQAAHFLKGGAEAALGDQYKKMRDAIASVQTKPDPKKAEEGGAMVTNAIKNITLTDLQSWKNAASGVSKGVETAFTTKKETQVQQTQAQKVEQTLHITSDVNADYFNQVVKKDAAFGFEFKNPNSYEVLMPAKRKGK